MAGTPAAFGLWIFASNQHSPDLLTVQWHVFATDHLLKSCTGLAYFAKIGCRDCGVALSSPSAVQPNVRIPVLWPLPEQYLLWLRREDRLGVQVAPLSSVYSQGIATPLQRRLDW